eukprot:COSAG02_NODE_44963_length_361_cov_0.988550_1_plen_25_part_10
MRACVCWAGGSQVVKNPRPQDTIRT